MMAGLELLVDAKALVGEGPCWDDREHVLYWVDISAYRIHRYDPVEGSNRTLELDAYVGSVVVRERGGLLAATQKGLHEVDFAAGTWRTVADMPRREPPGHTFNDGKCDPAGRFWIGTMAAEGTPDSFKPDGTLYMVDETGSLTPRLSRLTIPNGMAWSADSKTMYLIDSVSRQVAAWDYDLQTGTIRNKRTVVAIAEADGLPDGMTIDEEGMIWVAHWGGSRVTRWNPASGRMIGAIDVPARQTTSCAFGGKDLDTLYITSAREGLSEEELQRYPYSGGLFGIKPGVRGTPSARYRG